MKKTLTEAHSNLKSTILVIFNGRKSNERLCKKGNYVAAFLTVKKTVCETRDLFEKDFF